ncbi:MAG: hypothetical protein ACFCUN_10450 [Hyphomicrobiaceae bacterium]
MLRKLALALVTLSLGLEFSVPRATAMPAILSAPGGGVPACATPERLTAFLISRAGSVDPMFEGLADTYRVVGTAFGVRWDFAFFQMMVETNNLTFRYADGRPFAMEPEQFNFAGLGVTGAGKPGERFSDLTTGVQAHIEHILVYAGQVIHNPVAIRTRNVQSWGVLQPWLASFDRPVTFRDMALRWSPFSDTYAGTIAALATRFYNRYCDERPVVIVPAPIEIARLNEGWAARAEDRGGTWQTASRPSSTHADTQAAGGRAANRTRETTIGARNASAELPDERSARLAAAAPVAGPTSSTSGRPAPGVRRGQTQDGGRQPAAYPVADASKPTSPQGVQVAALGGLPTVTAPSVVAPPAQPDPDDDLRALVSDRTVHLQTDMGAVIPVRFRSNGSMSGTAGGLAFFLGAATDRGRWWVADGLLCKQWDVWLSAREMCLTLTKVGDTVHWRSRDGRSGTAKIIR